MTVFDGSRQDNLDGRLRGLLIEIGELLAPATVGLVHEMIDASESPIALDMMSEMLAEAGSLLDRRTVDEIAELASAMGLGEDTAGRLEPLVRTSTLSSPPMISRPHNSPSTAVPGSKGPSG